MNWQENLLREYKAKFPHSPLSPEVKSAFLACPRHEYVKTYPLHEAYADTTLYLYDKGEQVSTISQPTLVLRMLELLDVKPGMKIFELGAGSGWNAAMLGMLVGPTGKVISFEIIPEIAKLARENTKHLPQVEIIEGDAQAGRAQEAPFDRAVFTAGAYDIPPVFYEQIRDNGLLLFVLKTPNAGELLLSLRKSGHHFEEENRILVRFVSVTGKNTPHATRRLDEVMHSNRLWIYPKDEHVVLDGRTRVEGEFSQFLF